MSLKESITVQWNHVTRQFTVGSKFCLWKELEGMNCVPFDVFYHYNVKYLISKNIDFLVWAPSHASSPTYPLLFVTMLIVTGCLTSQDPSIPAVIVLKMGNLQYNINF